MTTRAPLLFDIPAGETPRQCNGCPALVYWIKTPKAGRPMPLDATVAPTDTEPGKGTSHFATCPRAAQFRRK